MAKWVFQPQHTGAEFSVRHMMVSQVRGCFKNVNGILEFDPDNPVAATVALRIDAATVWTGVPDLDAHLCHADFLDVANHPEIVFNSRKVELEGENDYLVSGDLTIRGVTRQTTLHVRYQGQWQTPWWEDGVNKGPKTRAGFVATTRINRQDFGVSWNDTMDRGGVVVSDYVDILIDVEAILVPG